MSVNSLDASTAATPIAATGGVDGEVIDAVDPAARAFSFSMLISGIRCTLTYVVFPWILPLVGVAGGVGPTIGLTVGTVAIVSNVASIRRFWRADHKWKLPITVVNVGVIVLLLVMIGLDISELRA